MNPIALMQIKPMFESFSSRHPKFVQFFGYAAQSMGENSLLEISVTDANGQKAVTNIRVSQEDIELIEQLKNLMGK